jgi:hypothetical protein
MQHYTRNKWRRRKNTLETSGEDVHRPLCIQARVSEVTKLNDQSQISPQTCLSSPLVSSVFFDLFHSFRVYFLIFSTRFECIDFTSLVSGKQGHLLKLHSFRVYFSEFLKTALVELPQDLATLPSSVCLIFL